MMHRRLLSAFSSIENIMVKEVTMNYRSGMMVKGEDKPCTNAVVFATEKEAFEAGKELMSRWVTPYDHCVITTTEPVNYRFNFDNYFPERIEPPMGVNND
jgi:hypothetical protein